MVVVAEGVEDEHHFQLLRDWGCDWPSCFIGRPMAWDLCARWAEQRRQASFGDAGPRATQLAQFAGSPTC